MTDHNDEPDADVNRGAVELLLGALAGSTLLPFVQAIAGKAGEDVYAKIRDKLSRRDRKRTEIEIREAGTVTVAANDSRIILQLPSSMTAAMAARLSNVRVPVERDQWLRVTWDAARFQWLVRECDEPPRTANVIDVDPGQRRR